MASVIIALIALLAAWGLIAESHRRAGYSGGRSWVRWGAGLKVAAIFGVVVMVKIAVDGVGRDNSAVAVIAAASYGLLVVPLFLNAFFWRVGYGADGVVFHSAWRTRRTVPWGDVTGVTFSAAMRHWKIATATHGVFRVNELAIGSDQLLQELERQGHRIPERPLPFNA